MKTLELDEDVTSIRTPAGQKVFVKRQTGSETGLKQRKGSNLVVLYINHCTQDCG